MFKEKYLVVNNSDVSMSM